MHRIAGRSLQFPILRGERPPLVCKPLPNVRNGLNGPDKPSPLYDRLEQRLTRMEVF